MEIIRLATVDSTSTRARELLAAGKAPPFVVLAERQTAGRGRRGSRWESPTGNLYASFAMPPAATADLPLAPLKAAVCCARAVRAQLGVRLTVKWPNDLLLAGQKVGGLLCETSTHGDQATELLIGVGLNLAVAPNVAESDAITPGALLQLLGTALDGDRFVRDFVELWLELPGANVMAAYTELATGIGQPWIDRQTGAVYLEQALGAGGELVLAAIGSLDEAASVRLSSVDHRYAWAYAGIGRDKHPLLVADCGNSRVKLAAFLPAAASEPHAVTAVPATADEQAWREALVAWHGPARTGWPLLIASVNPDAEASLARAASSLSFTPVALPKRRLRSHGDGYALAALGIDRLAAIEGVLARAGTERDDRAWTLVVSCGTALTIDAVRKDGWHAGGWILPGLGLGLAALGRAGRLLPELHAHDVAGCQPLLGGDTRTAMLWGAAQAAIGAIERAGAVLLGGRRVLGGEVGVVLTGGDAALVAPLLPQAELVANLVLVGIRAMALGGA